MPTLKTVFQYTIYPVFLGAAWGLMLVALQNGVNQYLATLPVVAAFGLLALLLERVLPFERAWLHGSDWNLDFTYYLINYLIKVTAQLGVLWLSTRVAFPRWFPTQLPFWAQVLLALTLIDFFLFFVHWQSHRYQWLWKLHAIHHSSERLYFLNGEKRHALHQVLEGAPGIAVCVVIGTPAPVIAAALALLAIHMMMQHTNLDYRAGFFKKLFCVAELHRWHHRADWRDAQVNFGAWLTVWDRLFRTSYDRPHLLSREALGEIGIREEPAFPTSYLQQARYPFVRKPRQWVATVGAVLLCLGPMAPVRAQPRPADALVGTWKNAQATLTVAVFREAQTYGAKIAQAPDPKQVGKIIIRNLVFDQESGEWTNGTLQLPAMAHAVSCFVRLTDANTLEVTGYHGLRLFGSTETYHRERP